MLHLELFRILSIIQPHTCLRAVVKFVNDGEHSRWHPKASKDIPQKGLVDGVICFGKVDKAHVQGGVRFPRHVLLSSYYEHHVNRRALGSEPTLFLRQNVLALAIFTQATRDDFEDYVSDVSQGDAAIIATLSPVFLLVKYLNRGIFLLSRYATSPPQSDDYIVERFRECPISLRRPKPSRARPGDHWALPRFGSPTHGSPSLLRT